MDSQSPKHLDFHLELANKIVDATRLDITIDEREQQKDWLMHAATNSHFHPKLDVTAINREIELLQSTKQKIISELSQYNTQHLSLFETFYYPEDAETLNVYGKNVIDWLKGIRTPYMPLHMASEKLRRELKPFQDRTITLIELENRLACRGFPESNLAPSLFPLPPINKVIEHRREEARFPIQHRDKQIIEPVSLLSEMHTDLQDFCNARQEYRKETKALRAKMDDLLRLHPSTPLLRPFGIKESDLLRAVHEIVQEIIHPMAEMMKDEVKTITGSARKSMVQHMLRTLERPHFLIERELKKQGLEEGEISELEDAFNLVFAT